MKKTEEIENISQLNTKDFSFQKTSHDFVINERFGKGYERIFEDSDKSYIWNVLSAIGNHVGNVIYSNVLHYSDLVSNVDTCKIKSLQSFINIFGLNYTIFQNLNEIPNEILSLIDILSINRKYLLKNEYINNELKDRIQNYSGIITSEARNSEWYYRNIENQFTIERTMNRLSSTDLTEARAIYGTYSVTKDIGYDTEDIEFNTSLSTEILREYQNDNGVTIAKILYNEGKDSKYVLSANGLFIGALNDVESHININNQTDTFQIYDLTAFTDEQKDKQFIEGNSNAIIKISYVANNQLSTSDYKFNEESYKRFINDIFIETLSHFIELPYNTNISDGTQDLSKKPIYSYKKFRNEYNLKDSQYQTVSKIDRQRYKIANNIELSFDEKTVVDNIENGLDYLENYPNNKQALLSIEIEYRKQRLNFQDIGYSIETITGDKSYENQSRYSYYREKKVWEYVNFIEKYMYSDASQMNNDVYEFNPNYFIKRSTDKENILIINDTDENKISVNVQLIENAAAQLTNMVMYIARLREKLKIQIRKNYTKGTSNLLKYVVNEYLCNFVANCNYFNEDYQHQAQITSTVGLQNIYDKLIRHSTDDIQVIEYDDSTEYFNIQTDNTSKTATKDYYNNDYFEEYFERDKSTNKIVQTKEPIELDVGEIRRFYLSTLMLNDVLDDEDELNTFLSDLYELGKSNNYIDATESVFVCDLMDGTNSLDIYHKYQKASDSQQLLNDYLSAGDYEFKEQQLSDQISDILENYLYVNLSNENLSDYSLLYDKYINSFDTIEASCTELQNQYGTMISSTYPYYYKKSTIKYCYTDNDVESGTYKHNYFVDNTNYNSEYLYNRLINLMGYSNNTNLRCYSSIDSMDYFNVEFNKIYSKYYADIVGELESRGFTNIEYDNFGTTLTNARSFATDYKTSKTQTQTDLYNEIKSDFETLKTTFTTQNNTLNSEVAKYDDSTYPLTADYIYKFSVTKIGAKKDDLTWEDDEIPTGYAKRKTQQEIDKEWKQYVLNSVIDSRTYYYYIKRDGTKQSDGYPFWEIEVSESAKYNKNDTLPNRCTQFLKWMDYGVEVSLIKEDINISFEEEKKLSDQYSSSYTTVQQVQSKLTTINVECDSIASRLKAAGCDDYDDSSITDLELRMTYMETYINETAKSKMVSQSSVLDEQIEQLTLLINSYTTINADYSKLMLADGIATYFSDTTVGTNVNKSSITNLTNYTTKKDTSNQTIISKEIDEFFDEYTLIQNQIKEQQYQIQKDLTSFVPFDDYIEIQLSSTKQALEDDKDSKYAAAILYIDSRKEEIDASMDNLREIIYEYGESTEPLTTVLEEVINDNDLNQNSEFTRAHEQFKTYTDTNSSYQGYFNYKNRTHATRQIHPFMWNFIKHVSDNDTISKIFYSYNIEELEGENAQEYIDKIVGKYGNLKNLWKYSIQDFSGYTTRYIANNNTTDVNTQIFEVAEYDGAFYPPAIEQYRYDYQKCINSLSSKITIDDICTELNDSGDIEYYLSAYPSSQLYTILQQKSNPYFKDYIVYNNLDQTISNYIQQMEYTTLSDELTETVYEVTTAKRKDFIKYLQNNVNKTFYERFYSNLELTQDETRFIAKQLGTEKIRERINDITDPKTKDNIYDIYNYALDQFNNIYILYKNYGTTNPSFKTKQNTLGQMWIRLKNHPIAFPMISEAENDKSTSQILMDTDTNSYLYSITYNNNIQRNYCYDFQMSYNKKVVVFVCKKTDDECGCEIDELFKNKYEYATLAIACIDKTLDERQNIDRITLTNNDGECDDVVTGYRKDGFVLPTADTPQYVYSFIGMYSPSSSKMNFVYTQKKLEYVDEHRLYRYIDKSIPNIAIQLFDTNIQGLDIGNSTIKSNWTKITPTTIKRQLISDVIFAYNKDNNELTFAFIKNILNSSIGSLNTIKTDHFNKQIDMDKDTEGATIKDVFSSSEMNSRDIFLQNICTLKVVQSSDSLKDKSYTENNINGDMSYIPVSPNKSNPSNVEDELKEYECYNIELLGRSKNIDSYINNTNPNPNPNFDINDILENKQFGRVYEDYLAKYDKSYDVYDNIALNKNQKQYCRYNEYGEIQEYEWSLNLIASHDKQFNENDLNNMKVMIYNKNCLGKNPYYFGNLNVLTAWRSAEYNDSIQSNERKISVDLDSSHSKYMLVGQNTVDGKLTQTDDNRIYNISEIKFKFDMENQNFTTRFIKNDASIDSTINGDIIRYVFFNTKDISLFEYYHLFDQYGLINVRFGNLKHIPDDKLDDGRGYSIIYDTSNYSKEDLQNKYRAFYNEYSVEKSLDKIQLSNYNALSDVYILSEQNRLSFKYSDQDIFHISSENYYFPSLNSKYPKNAAELISLNFQNTKETTDSNAIFNNTYDIFDNSNIFIVGLNENNDIINNIGYVDIPKLYKYDDSIIAFEDYLDQDSNMRKDIYDVESLQYLKFNTNVGNTLILSTEGGTELSDLGISTINKNSFDVLQELSELSGGVNEMFILSSEEQHTQTTKYQRVLIDDTTTDIEGLLNLYVNYKREDDLENITLYFNYNNYLNSPYIKFDDRYNILVNTIEGTYLKLKNGENGYLDIILQVKYYDNDILIGYENLNVLRYQLFNISDDKPKFIIRKISQMKKNQYMIDNSISKNCQIAVNDLLITQEELIPYEHEKLQTYITVNVYSDTSIMDVYDFYLYFPSDIFNIDTTRSSYGCTIEDEGNGCVHVTSIQNASVLKIPVITISNAFDLLMNNTIIYEMFVDEAYAYDTDMESITVNIVNGVFKVTDASNKTNMLLTVENESETVMTDDKANRPILTRSYR